MKQYYITSFQTRDGQINLEFLITSFVSVHSLPFRNKNEGHLRILHLDKTLFPLRHFSIFYRQ